MTSVTTEGLYRELRGSLLSFVRRRVATEQDAEDIVHDVFERLHARRDELSSAASVSGWVHRVTRNSIVDHYRARGAAERAITALGHGRDEETSGEAERDAGEELATCVAGLVDELPESYRQALRMTELEGLTQKDAAERAGLSLSGMKSRVQRGRTKLGELLLECCDVELDVRRRVVGYEARRPEDCCP